MCGNSLTRKTAIVKKKTNKQTKSKTEKETLEEKSDKVLPYKSIGDSLGWKQDSYYLWEGGEEFLLATPARSKRPPLTVTARFPQASVLLTVSRRCCEI